jgi:hypothetical protein
MAMKEQKSGILAHLGDKLRKAHEAVKGQETTFSTGYNDLPPGIEGGIAQLVDCGFRQIKEGKTNAGEYIWYAAGVVKEPEVVVVPGKHGAPDRVVRVRGLRTQVSEPMYDTPGRARETVQEHLGEVELQLRRLGLETKDLPLESLEEGMAALLRSEVDAEGKECGPHFKFRTWAGAEQEIEEREGGRWYVVEEGRGGRRQVAGPYASEAALKEANPYAGQPPRTNHVWNGALRPGEYTEDSPRGGVQDSTPPAGPRGASAPAAARAPSNGPVANPAQSRRAAPTVAERAGKAARPSGARPAQQPAPSTAQAAPPVQEESFGGVDEFGDLPGLVARALAGDDVAQGELTEQALRCGYTQDDVNAAADWDAVGALIGQGGVGGVPGDGNNDKTVDDQSTGGEPPAAPAVWVPKVGEVYLYKPKGAAQGVECEVTAVDDVAKSVGLKNLDDRKRSYRSVAWTELS